MIPQLATAIALILAPYSAPPTTPAPIGYPPGVAADVVARQIVSYVRYRDAEAIVALVVAEDAQKAAEAAQEAARGSTPVTAPQTVSGPCGGATNGADQYIARESGGDPSALNPSGAFGCYQIMPGTWASSCSDLGELESASPSAQSACASRLPLSAWSLG